MGAVIRDAAEGLRSVPVPQQFSIAFAGDYEEQQKAFRELLLSIILSLVLVYMVMACQYERCETRLSSCSRCAGGPLGPWS